MATTGTAAMLVWLSIRATISKYASSELHSSNPRQIEFDRRGAMTRRTLDSQQGDNDPNYLDNVAGLCRENLSARFRRLVQGHEHFDHPGADLEGLVRRSFRKKFLNHVPAAEWRSHSVAAMTVGAMEQARYSSYTPSEFHTQLDRMIFLFTQVIDYKRVFGLARVLLIGRYSSTSKAIPDMRQIIAALTHNVRKILFAILVLAGNSAQADFIDFVDMTENGAYGESAFSMLSIAGTGFNLDITATQNGQAAYGYLDWNHAGLGVCGDVDAQDVNVMNPGSGANVCNPGSDDNVTFGESLSFLFDVNVIIDKIWFNNTHDPDYTILFANGGDQISINGVAVNAVGNGYVTGNAYNGMSNVDVSNWLGSFNATGGVAFDIGFINEQFYISGMEVHAVPEPGTLALLGLGLFGLGLSRRRKA